MNAHSFALLRPFRFATNGLACWVLAAWARCISSTPEEAIAYAAKERAMWKDVVALSGAKAE